ncbi:MAG: hypothetical protein JSU82_16275 [Rhodospirillales bacterium]|nr:MAG: hypothetical protein JSU82_16275 [Rhodospirillales bacterium]
MAKKPSAPKSGAGKGGAKDIETRLVDAMLSLVETEGWRGTTVAGIAHAAGVPLSDLHPKYGSRLAIVAAYMRRIDRAVVTADFGFGPEDSARDRLFEVMMRRFDALRLHREALRRIRAGIMADPPAALALLPVIGCSMAWTLEAAEIPSDGASGGLKAAGLTAVWGKTLQVWLEDETPDLARTMAALDRNLGRASRVAEVLFGRRGRPTAEAA